MNRMYRVGKHPPPKMYPPVSEAGKKRIARYIEHLEADKLDLYYKKYPRQNDVGCYDFCPICGLREVRVVHGLGGTIRKLKCHNNFCSFLYNPEDIDARGRKMVRGGRRRKYENRKHVLKKVIFDG